MSTLDDLKKAAEATLRNQVKTPAADGANEEKLWRKLAPVMKYLQNHFTELADSLNVLEKDARVNFKINDEVTIKGLKAQNYKVTHPAADKEKEFVFEYENTGEQPAYITLPIGSPANSFKDTLGKNQIKYDAKTLNDNKAVKFEIKPLVRTKYRFAADIGTESIVLSISNYVDLWARTNTIRKNAITSELIDQLTKHVLREPNKYDEMMGNVISEEERTKIRENLKTQLNAKMTSGQPATTPPQQPAKKEKNLFGKLFRK